MVFKNRAHASELLAQTLLLARVDTRPTPDMETLVVALPRGGVPVALAVAVALHAPIDVLVSKKIGAPDQPEFAIGAVSSTGAVVTNTSLTQSYLHQLQPYISSERERLLHATQIIEAQWRKLAGTSAEAMNGRRVILVDDGIATGMTTLAALRSVRDKGASYVVLATPVIARDTLRRLSHECDLTVAVQVPEDLTAIALFYEDFHQVEDSEVIACLQASKAAMEQHRSNAKARFQGGPV